MFAYVRALYLACHLPSHLGDVLILTSTSSPLNGCKDDGQLFITMFSDFSVLKVCCFKNFKSRQVPSY